MKKLEFKEVNAQKIYDDYMRRIERSAKALSKDDRLDVLLEFNSHIFEGMERSSDGSEMDNLLPILERLGAPEEVLAPMIADKKLKEATRTFNPKTVFHALILNVRNGLAYAFFGFLYLILLLFFVLIGFEIFYPENTGLFMEEGKCVALGSVSDLEGKTEILGYWFMPIMLISMTLLYLLITFLLRWWSRKT